MYIYIKDLKLIILGLGCSSVVEPGMYKVLGLIPQCCKNKLNNNQIQLLFKLISFVCLFVVKIWFLCVALALLELSLWTRLDPNSQNSPASASQMLELKVCTTTAWLFNFFSPSNF